MVKSLAVFVAVVESGNFTRAGERVFLSQSAVSRIIEALEREYGVTLLDRTNKSVQVTTAGRILYQQALQMMRLVDETHQKIRELRDTPAGLLRIGAGFTYGEYILPNVIAEFIRHYPLVNPKITIMNSQRIAMQVREGILHLGIIEGDVALDGLRRTPFADDELVVVVPPKHRFSDRLEVSLTDLAEERWILRESGSAIRQIVDRVFEEHQLTPNLLMDFGSSQIIKESVVAGLGISMMSQSSIRAEIRQGLLVPLRLTRYPIMSQFCWVVNTSGFQPKVVTVFEEFLAGYSTTQKERASHPKEI